ncbi:CRISPR-associated endoribonuclease Cas6 [Crossiella sp. SN42]|uniref:CRISPR-associated endoribonuclease Cas6 n=1 Tax=Crossiella sp. SN42 TaxID=2944808 RepID=UPI00207C7D29|nr:CRISPR-associated endoribonuclease Cas6 [Crossiella sp. SN42]MCO1575121.1 CRISPR-associated endoribonuclease Cas6 [Crossiella sp. SN42]
MPVRIRVELEPEQPTAVPPPQNAPAVNAAFLAAIRATDKGLATALHNAPRYKPFTLTPLLDHQDATPTDPGQPARFEVGLLADELTAPVLTALHGRARIRVGTTGYRVAEVGVVAAASYEALAHSAATRNRWSFTLITPVSFATAANEGVRRERPWPDPDRIFTNLANRWDTFAGDVCLPLAAGDLIRDNLETTAGTLRLVPHLVKAPDIHRQGSVGEVTFRAASATGAPAEAVRAVDALATFANTAGFGDRTALGMGYVRLHQAGLP